MRPVVGVGVPDLRARTGPMVKVFPGGQGENNCPRFFYIRDGFGCTFSCSYCYLRRLERHHEGAEIDPNVDRLYSEVGAFLARPGRLGLILGEVTDAWGWARLADARAPERPAGTLAPASAGLPRRWVEERNLKLIEMFRAQQRHTLIMLTKSARVSDFLGSIEPTPSVVLAWSLNAPQVAASYEMGAIQAEDRLADAARCRLRGWRVRVRVDPMIPIPNWSTAYRRFFLDVVTQVQPEQVTVGSWRPRAQDPAFTSASPEMRALFERSSDGRYRLTNRVNMYRLAFNTLRAATLDTLFPPIEVSLCKEDFDVQARIYGEFGIRMQACNCLGQPVTPVGMSAEAAPRGDPARVHLPVVGGA